jgi:hypothetical protein
MKISRVWLSVCAGLLLFLSACTTTSPTADLESLATPLKGITTKVLIDPEQGNCSIDEFKMPGEGLRTRGATGGIAVVNEPYPNMPTALAYPTSTGRYVKNVAALYGKPVRPVGILIVDDFQSGVYTLGIGVVKLEFNSYTTKDPIARAIEIEAELDRLQAERQLSHGALVFNHTVALLVSAGYTTASFDYNTGLAIFVNPKSNHTIFVQLVDTEGFDTNIIAERTAKGLAGLRNLALTDIAVNMSFSIVPCSVRNDFAANRAGYPTFQGYATEIAAINGGIPIAQVYAAIRRPVNLTTDPLGLLIKSETSEGNIFVSAAGNYGLTYPMYPAAWKEVISVSSHDSGAGFSTFSNRGEIMITGAWFRLTNPAGINGGISDAPNVVYAGTSFAAPAITVFSAYDLASEVPQCGLQQGVSVPDLAYGQWRNIRLATAAKVYGVDINGYCAR